MGYTISAGFLEVQPVAKQHCRASSCTLTQVGVQTN